MRVLLSLFFATGIAALIIGCGGPSGPPTFPVKGKVSLDGTAIDDGLIKFDSQDPKSPSYSRQIKNGEYTVDIAAGKYTVMVTATKKGPYPPGVVGADGEKEGPIQYIPAKFNEQTTLSADISASTKELDFHLKK